MTDGPAISRRVILDIFILSGAAGLIYEVVWARQLVLVFGNTTQAVSAILTGFFGGMAIGSALGGRLADRIRRPLRMYGLLEVILVVVVVLTPITFRLLHEVYRGVFSSLESSPGLLALVRFGLALVALSPATILMGATLPTLTRYLTQHADQLSDAFGRLYAANTLGAIVGTILAGFILIELLGLSGTLLVGAACSAGAAAIALLLDRRVAGSETRPGATPIAEAAPAEPTTVLAPLSPTPTAPSPAAAPSRTPTALRIGVLVAFVSGLTALGYQTLWTRLLASGTGNSTYVFTMILSLFLIGIALGAIAFNVLRPRIRNTVGLLAFTQLVTAVLAVVGAIWVIPAASHGILELSGSPGALFGSFLRTSALVVLPATFVMGLSFPAASALVAGRDSEIGSRAGLVLAVNTTGAIVATFLIPFVVIPAIGSPATLALLAIVNAGLAVVLALSGGLAGRVVRGGIAIAGTAAIVLIVAAVGVGGLFVDPSIARIEKAGGNVLHTAEDEIASVQAGLDKNGTKHLWVTGTAMTLLTVDAKLMPVLPLIARPNSTSAAVVAFGMGSAFRGALIAGLKTDAVELVPSVPKMFGTYYDDAASVLANPNGRVIIADGRNHIELTERRYDIIVTDPPPPIESAGVSVISSEGYYAAGKDRLNPGGVMMQWVPWGQTLEEFLAHVRSFRAVYPQVLIAFGPGGYGLFMLGSEDPISFDPANIATILARPGVTEDLSSAFDSPEHDVAGWARKIPSLVWISGNDVARVAGEGSLITDDHPLPEYFLLRHAFGARSPQVSPGLLIQLSTSP
ncbi:MAG: fused MFS/spermidine synthase [Chloroflexota bacterium]